MRRLMLGVLFLTLSASAAERKGFVWASRPSAPAQYTATDAYASNSAGGPVTVAREEAGSYTVTFQQLARGATGSGNVQVTAYGGRSQTCNLLNWTGAEDLAVKVRCFTLATGEPADSRFSLLVTWAPEKPKLMVLPQPAAASAPAEEGKKSVLPDGSVVTRYPDRIVTQGAGFRHTKYLDGRPDQRMSFNTGAPANIPPTPPDNSERNWLTWHSERLLGMIESLVGNDQVSIDNYVQSEPANLTVYERINRRRDTINLLLN